MILTNITKSTYIVCFEKFSSLCRTEILGGLQKRFQEPVVELNLAVGNGMYHRHCPTRISDRLVHEVNLVGLKFILGLYQR